MAISCTRSPRDLQLGFAMGIKYQCHHPSLVRTRRKSLYQKPRWNKTRSTGTLSRRKEILNVRMEKSSGKRKGGISRLRSRARVAAGMVVGALLLRKFFSSDLCRFRDD